MAYDYQGKLVLIAGASAGLGRALARAYHEAGAKLALVARNAQKLEQLQAQGLNSRKTEVGVFPADLLNLEGIPGLVEKVSGKFHQPVDVLVHCAAMSCYGEVERTPFEMIEQVTRLNYLAGVRLVQELLGPMKERGSGQIVWIGSASAFRGRPLSAAYCASKAAAKSFCEALRGEVKPFGVDVLYVMPGSLKTGFHEAQANYSRNQRLRPLRSPSNPEDLARAILGAGRFQQPVLVYGRGARIQQRLSRWAPVLLDRAFQEQIHR